MLLKNQPKTPSVPAQKRPTMLAVVCSKFVPLRTLRFATLGKCKTGLVVLNKNGLKLCLQHGKNWEKAVKIKIPTSKTLTSCKHSSVIRSPIVSMSLESAVITLVELRDCAWASCRTENAMNKVRVIKCMVGLACAWKN